MFCGDDARKRKNISVLIAEKANIRRSGCLAAGVNAINAYITEGRVPQDYVDYAKKMQTALCVKTYCFQCQSG